MHDPYIRQKSIKRVISLFIAFVIFLSYLLSVIFRLQFFEYDKYKEKVFNQITTESTLIAERGNIYDRNMTLLATTKTVWRVFVSSRDIAFYTKQSGRDYAREIANGLSPILMLSEEFLYQKMTSSKVLDVTLKKSVDENTYNKLILFISENHFEKLIFTEAQSSRYYPMGTMFAHVLGFVGSDNQGLYGLEYTYNDTLSGKNGSYLYAKDANGNVLPTEYSTYIPAENGYNIVTTLDTYVQEKLEQELEKISKTHGVNNRVCGIVMDTSNGAILAMATSNPFDPNTPYILDSQSLNRLLTAGLDEGSDEYKKMKKDLLEVMWSNKAVSELYEPGSTFKVITVSTALNSGVATLNDRFSCTGSLAVGGWRIRCHKIKGHGSNFTLAYGLQMSCNPTMMQIASRIGAANFYQSIKNFGYFEKTGIDLPSESKTIFHQLENIGPTELATISFGQRFKVSIIQQLNAIATVANGGVCVKPHLLERIIDENEITIKSYDSHEQKRVIDESVARAVADALEQGVSGDGGAKNAYVDGYKVAAKTGTSEKFDILDENGKSYLRVGSTVAFAPSDTGGIATIIVVDEPTSQIKYGSYVAAPYVSSLLSSILPYLGYEKNKEEINIKVDDYTGLNISDATQALQEQNLMYEIVGNGDKVLSQIPAPNDIITSSITKVTLYTQPNDNKEIEVPDVRGKSAKEANEICLNLGLSLRLCGAIHLGNYESIIVTEQSIPRGTVVPYGTTISLTILSIEGEE